MKTPHLTATQIHELVHLKVHRAEAIPLLAHLVMCAACRDEVARQEVLKGPAFLQQTRLDRDVRTTPAGHGKLNPRDLADTVRREDADASNLLLELVRVPRSQRPLVVRNKKRYHTLGMVRRLMAEAKAKFRVHPSSAEELASLALLVAEQIDDATYGPTAIGSQRALARGYLANALRAQRQFTQAARELHQAWHDLYDLHVSAPLERAWLLRFQSSLARDMHQYSAAQECAQEARGLYRRLGQMRDALWMLVAESIALYEGDQANQALKLFEAQAEEMTEDVMGLSEYLAYRSLRTILLVRAGRFIEAREMLPELRRLNARHGEWNLSARISWVQAMVFQGLDQGSLARRHFREALDLFTSHGFWLDGALVTLELSQLCLEQGRLTEAQRLAQIAAPIFEAHGQTSDALTALHVFLRAAQQARASLELLYQARDAVRSQQREG